MLLSKKLFTTGLLIALVLVVAATSAQAQPRRGGQKGSQRRSQGPPPQQQQRGDQQQGHGHFRGAGSGFPYGNEAGKDEDCVCPPPDGEEHPMTQPPKGGEGDNEPRRL